MLKKERFYAATVGKDAAEVIESYKTGVELDCFCWSVRLEEKDAIDEALGYMKLTNRHILHGPFTELYPAAIDPEAVDLAYKRLEQAYDISRRLGIDRMVVHSGYLPFIYFKEWHIEKSAQFWNNFMRNKDENFKIYIENVLEDEPYMMKDLMEAADNERIKLCIDTGHAAVMSKVPVSEWIKVLGSYTGHFHIHNNNGKDDIHGALSDGILDMDEILKEIEIYCGDASITVEAYDLEASFKWLKERETV